MRAVIGVAISAVTLTAKPAAAAGQQVTGTAPARQMIALSSPLSNVVREIADPATGDRWVLERDPASPAGPGRLVQVAAGKDELPQSASNQNRNEKASPARVIHAGDRVVVEEHTALMDAELEGIALSGARSGATLRVRLRIGGRILNAVALGPGRVAIRLATGVRP